VSVGAGFDPDPPFGNVRPGANAAGLDVLFERQVGRRQAQVLVQSPEEIAQAVAKTARRRPSGLQE